MHGQLLLEFRHSGRGRGRDDDLQIGRARLQRLDELRANVHFADADGVKPDNVAISDGLLEFGVVSRETLAETFLPVPTPPHLQKIKRGTQQEENVKAQVVKETNHLRPDLPNQPGAGEQKHSETCKNGSSLAPHLSDPLHYSGANERVA